MYNILMKNIRCFSDEQIVPVKPLTILVGENSSGKSTFLASTRLAWDLVKGSRQIDFNEDLFILGSFDQIATYRGGKSGRAKEFTIGVQIEVKKKGADNKFSPRPRGDSGGIRGGRSASDKLGQLRHRRHVFRLEKDICPD